MIIDVTISYEFEAPKNNIRPSVLSRYFDYGRPIESKIFRLAGTDDLDADNIAKAGWFKGLSDNQNFNNSPENNKQRVLIYGMSFSNHIGKIISKKDRSLDVRMFAGPGAPLNHSYAYYQRHRPHKKGDIVVLGILASSIPRMNTLTHMTKSFESPAPHFYPRYYINEDNQLVSKHIQIESLEELRHAMHNKERWEAIKKSLETDDSFYNEILFTESFTAKSSYLNLIRRAWGQWHTHEIIEHYHDDNGFKNTDRLVDISQIIVANFAEQVRNDGAIPYVILFNSRNYKDHLYTLLESTLKHNNIPFLSTHKDYPAEELSNFISDGHFTPEVDHLIAESVLKDIHKLIKTVN